MERKLFIRNRKGQELSAVLHSPDNPTDKIIVISHSFKGTKDIDTISKNFCDKACSIGVSAIRYDCWGSGDSDGAFQNATVTTELHDLQDVIDYARINGYRQVGLAGLSLGASLCILAFTPDIRCLVLWSPALELSALHERYKDLFRGKGYIDRVSKRSGKSMRIGRGMWESFGQVRVKDRIQGITAPTLIVSASEDVVLGQVKEEYVSTFKCIIKHETIEGADHDFTELDKENKAVSISIDWIKKYL